LNLYKAFKIEIGKVTVESSNKGGATKDEILSDIQQIRGNASNVSNITCQSRLAQ